MSKVRRIFTSFIELGIYLGLAIPRKFNEVKSYHNHKHTAREMSRNRCVGYSYEDTH